jgi:hypothetical protein
MTSTTRLNKFFFFFFFATDCWVDEKWENLTKNNVKTRDDAIMSVHSHSPIPSQSLYLSACTARCFPISHVSWFTQMWQCSYSGADPSPLSSKSERDRSVRVRRDRQVPWTEVTSPDYILWLHFVGIRIHTYSHYYTIHTDRRFQFYFVSLKYSTLGFPSGLWLEVCRTVCRTERTAFIFNKTKLFNRKNKLQGNVD